MPLLPELVWRTSYRHDDGDLIELFYNAALFCAKQYDRMTGYFTADALALASRGIDQLIANDGRMRLIVGCTLNPDETDAIGQGYEWRELIEQQLASVDLTPPDERARSGFELVAWMVAQGHLDVKVAVPVDDRGRPTRTSGIYHEKVGVVTDDVANRISFSGSINETAGGWLNNRESFHVYLSWDGGREAKHVEDEVDAFARLWDDRSPSIKIFDFPDAAKKRLLEYLPSNDRFVSPPLGGQRAQPDTPEVHRLLPVTFCAIDGLVQRPEVRPAQAEWRPLDARSYSLRLPGMQAAARITTDPVVFEESEENHQLLGPGGDLFEKLAAAGGGPTGGQASGGGTGVCWQVEIESTGETVFLIQTLEGLRRIQNVAELSAALERVGEPVVFPFESWPGSEAQIVA